MRKYNFELTINSGEQVVKLGIVAKDNKEALKKYTQVTQSQGFIEKLGDGKITQALIDFEGTPIDELSPERFVLQKSQKPNYHIITDTKTLISILFRDGSFNEDQKVTMIDDKLTDARVISSSLSMIGDFIAQYHPELI